MEIDQLVFEYIKYNLNNPPLSLIDYLKRVLNYTEDEANQCLTCVNRYYEN